MRHLSPDPLTVAGGEAPPAVGRRVHCSLVQELADQARRLGPAQSAELLHKTPHQALFGAAQLGVVVPTQHGFDQGVLPGPAGSFELEMLTALKEPPDQLQASACCMANPIARSLPPLELGSLLSSRLQASCVDVTRTRIRTECRRPAKTRLRFGRLCGRADAQDASR